MFKMSWAVIISADLGSQNFYSKIIRQLKMSHSEDQFVKQKDLINALENCERRYDELLRAVTDYTYTVTVENGVAVKTIHSEACVGVTGFTSE